MKSPRGRAPWYLVFAVLAASGCDQVFTPNMQFQRGVVVYAILSNEAADQAIRVYTTYDSDALEVGQAGPDTRLRNALVLVSDLSVGPGSVDTCGYSEAEGVYLWSPTVLSRGHRYRIVVKPADLNSVTSEVSVAQVAQVAPGSYLTLRQPSTYIADFIVSIRLAPEAKAYLLQLMLDYQYFDSQSWVDGRLEVPRVIGADGSGAVVQLEYPQLTRRLGNEVGGDAAYQIVGFDHDAYMWALSKIRSRYEAGGLKFTQAVVRLTQIDEDLYNYYNIANGFKDPYTIRTDFPDYTNIAGGHGIFGAAVVDSIVISLPEVIR